MKQTNFLRERSDELCRMSKELTIIMGPTAVGKTDYSISLAKEYGSPIVSCDSRQIFKEMRIGTAPPSAEQLEAVKHYFIFSNSVSEYYTAGQYEIDALALLGELFHIYDRIVMVGGSGLYIDALCYGLDDFPQTDQTLRGQLMERLEKEGIESLRMELKKIDPETYYSIDIANWQRIVRALEVNLMTGRKFSSFKSNRHKERPFNIKRYCLARERDILYERINTRVDKMMEDGLVKEVESLSEYRSMPALNTVGYKEIFDMLDGKISQEEAVRLIKRNTRRYAKRQMTYWRNEEKVWLND